MTTTAAPPATPTARRSTRPRSKARTSSRTGLAFVSPALVLLVLFFFIPVALCFLLAFTNARLISR